MGFNLGKILGGVVMSEKRKLRDRLKRRIYSEAEDLKLLIRTDPLTVTAAIDDMADRAWGVIDEVL